MKDSFDEMRALPAAAKPTAHMTSECIHRPYHDKHLLQKSPAMSTTFDIAGHKDAFAVFVVVL